MYPNKDLCVGRLRSFESLLRTSKTVSIHRMCSRRDKIIFAYNNIHGIESLSIKRRLNAGLGRSIYFEETDKNEALAIPHVGDLPYGSSGRYHRITRLPRPRRKRGIVDGDGDGAPPTAWSSEKTLKLHLTRSQSTLSITAGYLRFRTFPISSYVGPKGGGEVTPAGTSSESIAKALRWGKHMAVRRVINSGKVMHGA